MGVVTLALDKRFVLPASDSKFTKTSKLTFCMSTVLEVKLYDISVITSILSGRVILMKETTN